MDRLDAPARRHALARLAAAAPLALALAALLPGCADTFTPASVVEDLRVLALVASPPEVGLGETVTVRPVDARPLADLAPLTERWTFCPFSLGASTGYACAVPLCETPLVAVGGAVTLDPTRLAQDCLALLGGSLPADPGGGLPASVDVLVRYVVSDGATTREAVQRIPVTTTGPPPARNRAPVISGISIGGQPAIDCGAAGAPDPCPTSGELGAANLPIAVSIDPTSIDTYLDGTGRIVTETIAVSFFTTAGRFTEERGQAPLATTELKHESVPAGTTAARLWVVARDLRGGEATAGPFELTVAP
jgi:hypothetical protein